MNKDVAIPEDLGSCQTLIVEMAQTISEQAQMLSQQGQEISELKLTVDELLRQAFRKRSERYLEDPNQLKLDFGNSDEAADAASGLADAVEEAKVIVEEHERRKRAPKQPRNEQLPAHLPRYEVEAEVPDDIKQCSEHGERTLIGHDRIETLEFERPKLKVRVTLIPKFTCQCQPECGVVEPPRPPGLVEGNRYDTSVAAEVIVGKYGYHLPIYRQQDWFAGTGWTPARSTLLNIASSSAELVQPFVDYLRNEAIRGGVIGTDDTRVTLLLPKVIPEAASGDTRSERIHEVFSQARREGRPSVSGRMWAYRSMMIPLNIFDFTVSRHRDGPDEFLIGGNFTGKLMADCYAGYQGITLRSDSRIERAACVAHARRKIFEARDNEPLLASQLLAMFQELYDVESRAEEMTVEQRQGLRDDAARPIWQRIGEVIRGKAAAALLPKDKLSQAIGYVQNQWDALQLYLSDGRLPIDNNDVEQLMKQVATGRKNWLFIGSVDAGERAARLLTLVSSALRNDLDVWAYVKDVLDRLVGGSTDYESLRPDRWAEAHPEHIRVYRQRERRYKAEAKRVRRARRRLTRAAR